jgi:hypothetical protein
MAKQEELVKIFKTLKKLLKKYENPLKPKIDLDSRYDLWSVKDLVISNRPRKEVNFASLIIQRTYVGFYYMPIYTDTKPGSIFAPELLKTLKGKSCFHIKSLDKKLESQIKDALNLGFKLYKKRGWI